MDKMRGLNVSKKHRCIGQKECIEGISTGANLKMSEVIILEPGVLP